MSLAEEYREQHRRREWARVYDALPLPAGGLVVDVGCGPGDQAADLVGRGARVLGIDAHPELIRVAKDRGLERADFVEADLRSWSAPALGADGLWCSFSPAYFLDLASALRRWCAVLRPGGWAALIEIDELFGHEPLSAAAKRVFADYADDAFRAGRYDFRMGRRLASEAAAAGLMVESSFELPDQEFSFAGPATEAVRDAWSLRLERMTLLQRLAGEAWPAVRDEFLACLARADHVSTCRVIFVLARKRG